MGSCTHGSCPIFIYIHCMGGSPDVEGFGTRHPASYPKQLVCTLVRADNQSRQAANRGGQEMISKTNEEITVRPTPATTTQRIRGRVLLIGSALALLLTN